jgi:hypothetical protein
MHRKLLIGFFAWGFAFVLFAATRAIAQDCPLEARTGPSTPSKVRSLEGKLVFHNGIRGWLELRLDKPQCGNDSIQLASLKENVRDIEVFRGCRVRSTGALDFSGTGYWSATMFQDVEKLEPVGTCLMQAPFPDYSSAIPDKAVGAYRVDMHVDYRPGDHPVEFRVQSANRELRPWQAYASYMLTGGYVLYGYCAKGFVVDKVYGTPAARPMHFDEPRTPEDAAAFDPESAAAVGTWDLHLRYTCVRQPRSEH